METIIVIWLKNESWSEAFFTMCDTGRMCQNLNLGDQTLREHPFKLYHACENHMTEICKKLFRKY